MFRAVLFDWDGTLADSTDAVVAAFQQVLQEAGCPVSREFIQRRIGIGAENTFREALESAEIAFTPEKLEQLVERKVQVEIDMADKVRLFDGALELLKSLDQRMKMALASMNNGRVIHGLLRAMEIKRYFDAVVTVDDVLRSKPDPEIFQKCAQHLAVSPEESVVVEDSIFGVQAAKTAGMRCIAVLTGAYSPMELREENPDLLVQSVKEREKILSFLLGEEG
jgi:HAD superfamily hydrolase (TIGR01509 family)